MAASAVDFSALVSGAEETDEKVTRNTTRKSEHNPLKELVAKAKASGKAMTLPPVPGNQVAEIVTWIRLAAKDAGHGVKFELPKDYATKKSVSVKFETGDKRAYSPRESATKVECPVCHNSVVKTSDNKLRVHGPRDNRCKGSGQAA